YISVGRKGTELLYRMGKDILADFGDLPAEPVYTDVSAIGRMAVDEYLEGNADEVHLAYTDFVNMIRQIPTSKKLLPLEFDESSGLVEEEFTPAPERTGPAPAYFYEPSQDEILDEIIPSFTGLQVYQAVLESLASEHASRMVAMKSATDNATDMAGYLQLEYNKARQQSVTNEMLDIAGGAEALAQAQ
ncbi:MAG: F0F1 ATP synthase subunit gamma, partial [Chloroflexota bacterium]